MCTKAMPEDTAPHDANGALLTHPTRSSPRYVTCRAVYSSTCFGLQIFTPSTGTSGVIKLHMKCSINHALLALSSEPNQSWRLSPPSEMQDWNVADAWS